VTWPDRTRQQNTELLAALTRPIFDVDPGRDRRSAGGRMSQGHVFVLVPTAVYDHGVAGVFETREAAEQAAERLWRTSDGYHAFRVDERRIGVLYDVYPLGGRWDGPPTDKPLRVTFADESDALRFNDAQEAV
jgi:hypothetical protein